MSAPSHFAESRGCHTQGFSETIRSEAWKFLLHMYPFNTTSLERHGIDRNKTFVLPHL